MQRYKSRRPKKRNLEVIYWLNLGFKRKGGIYKSNAKPESAGVRHIDTISMNLGREKFKSTKCTNTPKNN
jgi:hypothetical protein